jgi:hypothetical protein
MQNFGTLPFCHKVTKGERERERKKEKNMPLIVDT